MARTRSRSPSVISISSTNNPIVSKKTGRPILTTSLISSDDDEEEAAEGSLRPVKRACLIATGEEGRWLWCLEALRCLKMRVHGW